MGWASQLTAWVGSGHTKWTHGQLCAVCRNCLASPLFVDCPSERPPGARTCHAGAVTPDGASVCRAVDGDLILTSVWRAENTDASQAIFQPPPENWSRPPGAGTRTTWMKNIPGDPSSLDLGTHEARDLAQNQPLWRLVSAQRYTQS